MPLRPQEGHKRPHIAERGLSRFRGRLRAGTSKAFLPLSDTSAFCIQFQLVELPLVELFYSLPYR